MKKVLFVASISGHITAFHIPFLKLFKENGYEVDVAARYKKEIPYCDTYYDIEFERNPLKRNNLKAYKELKKVVHNGNYDVIHCHTPVAAMLTRLAARKMRKKGSKVIYTAHGFHFFKGAPLINWLLYFPVEWVCAFFTDVLITINKEDYAFAKKHIHAKRVEYVPGVGIDLERIENALAEKELKRQELGLCDGDVAVLSVGELNDNKNHETVLRAVASLGMENIKYIVCGKGNKENYLKELASELGIANQLILLGFRRDIPEICYSCDIFAFPSFREGLPVSVMEAMCAGLPVIASDIRGIRDLIEDGKNGYLCSPSDVAAFAEKIRLFIENKKLCDGISQANKEKVMDFSMEKVMALFRKIYGM